ncbi:MarC family protein [Phaeodactylibacter sp.]|jgi:multiple antibiotic resistance protein|uniref:MarC family protein n=1 Tax=Phaeodactylibacter sp. TaxID=1940289 RepID=UPI0025E594BF|nr:MarC family protein [Phaeodactylibacter sp.]MCI4649383.1 MarC family protein [Phaeodactylibacter sp.]MCI5092794.1 MarC family protein [Phaeodactylibacter sp.]
MNTTSDMINPKDLISVSLILFSVIDIIGSIPLIIDMKKRGVKIESAKASVIAMVLMLLFLLTGRPLLSLFGVDVESFAVAGSIIIFLLGIEMVLGITLFRDDHLEEKTGTIVPIAFPLLAGAGTMTTILTLKAKYEPIDIALGIVLNTLIVFLVLRSSDWISKKLGESGANVLRKVFGIILLAIAIKIFRENFHLMTKVDLAELTKQL